MGNNFITQWFNARRQQKQALQARRDKLRQDDYYTRLCTTWSSLNGLSMSSHHDLDGTLTVGEVKAILHEKIKQIENDTPVD